MSVFARLIAGEGSFPPPAHDDFWYTDPGWLAAGVRVTPERALQIGAVLACVNVRGETFAQVPLKVYEKEGRNKREARELPLFDILYREPNSWQTSSEFRETLLAHYDLRGNAYAEKVPGVRGSVNALEPLMPNRVKVRQLANRRMRYENWSTDGSVSMTRYVPQDQMMHIRGLSLDGIEGLNKIQLAAKSVGLSIAAHQFTSDFYKNGATPRLALEYPGELNDESEENIRKSLMKPNTGPGNQWKTMILEEGMKANVLGITPEDGLLLGILKYTVNDIARLYRVPLHMIQETEKSTSWGTGIEQMSIGFVVYTMAPIFVRFEQAILRDLITEPDRYYAKFEVSSLLRGDQKARYESYRSSINAGWMSRNEARDLEDLDPMEGLDKMLVAKNVGMAGQENEPRDASAQEPGLLPGRDDSVDGVDDVERIADAVARKLLGVTDPIPGGANGGGGKGNLSIAKSAKPQKGAVDPFGPLVEDAAVRISNREVRELEKCVLQFAGGKKFEGVLGKFYEKHREYVEGVLRPLASALVSAGKGTLDMVGILAELVDASREKLLESEEPKVIVESWKVSSGDMGRRAEEVKAIIERGISDGGSD